MSFDCNSGIRPPAGGLLDADYAYAVMACGFVVRAPAQPYMSGCSRELQNAMDAHCETVHSDWWLEVTLARSMSAD